MITPVDVGLFTPILFILCGVLLVVLRAGASRVFFDVVGVFQANKMLQDTEAAVTMMNAIVIDGLSGMEESGAMVAEQMQKIVEATVPLSYELEKATIEFDKFINLSLKGGPALSGEVRDVGLQFGFTAEQSLEAGARMAQLSSIIGQETVPQATEMALAFGLIGDMSPEAAMQKLINLQQQTGFIFKSTTKAAYDNLSADQKRLVVKKEMADVLNTLNKVEDNSAATMSKITNVMNEFASQAHLAGESISMMAAMSATLIEAGEEQGKGGRALRMIYARLGADTGGAATTLQKLGVETKNADGSLRALSDVLTDLNPKWEQMNSGQKQFIAQQVAGNRHYVRFIKLAENHDRILQLNNATTGKMGEVYSETLEPIGFLNALMESNAISLDKVNAELEINAALMGNFFIPTTIGAKEFQLEFNKELTHFVFLLDKAGTSSYNLGKVLRGFFEFQQIISSSFAPFFSAMINVKAMNIALMTQRQIMRALQGVALSKNATTKKAQEQEQIQHAEIIMLMEAQIALSHEMRVEEMARAGVNKTAAGVKKGNMQTEIVGLHKVRNAVLQNEYAVESLTIVEKERAAYNKIHAKINAYLTKHEVTSVKELLAVETLYHSTRDMAIRDSRTLALATENLVIALEGEITRRKKGIMVMDEQIVMYEILGGKVDGAVLDQHRMGASVTLTDAAIEAQTMSIMKWTMTIMKVGMVFFIAEMAVMAFKDSIPGIRDEAHAARIAFILMGMAMVAMTAEMIYSMGATMRNTAVKAGNSAATVTQTFLAKNLIRWKIVETQAVVANTRAWLILNSVVTYGGFLVAMVAIVAAIDLLLPKMEDMTGELDDASDAFLNDAGAMEDWAYDMNGAMDTLDWSVFDEGTESIEGFNNAREEMFFGFKAGQVTGDLIKQVQQGGVGSFIANTEIIMTNTFNGMTTEEVADQIIEQIERKAGISGLNASVAVN